MAGSYWAVDDKSVQVTVLDDGQPLLKDKNITITLIRIAGGFSTDLIVTEAIIALRALPPCSSRFNIPVHFFSPPLSFCFNLTFQTGIALYFTSGKIISVK